MPGRDVPRPAPAAAAGPGCATARPPVPRALAGKREHAKALFRRAADAEDRSLDGWKMRRYRDFLPYGLDPNGTPTAPWADA